MKRIVYYGLFIATITIANQIPKSNITPLSNINTSTGIVFPANKFRLIIKHESFSKDTMYNGDTQITNPKSPMVKEI